MNVTKTKCPLPNISGALGLPQNHEEQVTEFDKALVNFSAKDLQQSVLIKHIQIQFLSPKLVKLATDISSKAGGSGASGCTP